MNKRRFITVSNKTSKPTKIGLNNSPLTKKTQRGIFYLPLQGHVLSDGGVVDEKGYFFNPCGSFFNGAASQ
jgi:hypothetical protein